MGGRARTPGKHRKARARVAPRDARIADIDRSPRRLADLYAISKLLIRFEALERTIPAVIAIVAQTLPMRSAIFIVEIAGAPHTIAWLAAGERAQRLREAEAHAQTAYRYLVTSGIDLAHGAAATLGLPRLAATPATAGKRRFVLLPFVIEHGSIFGALQIDGASALDEPDLVFVNAVVNQLAIALGRDATERALRRSEAQLAGIVSGAADAIISVDERQRIVMYNGGAEHMFGWLRDEVLGKPLDILLPERLRDGHRRHVRAFATEPSVARKMGSSGTEIFALRKTGEQFPADAAISKLDVGAAWLFTVILRDITEHKRVEHDERFLADVGAILAATLDVQGTLASIAALVLRDLAEFCVVDLIDPRGDIRRAHVASSDPAKLATTEALTSLDLDFDRPHLSSVVMQSRRSQLITTVGPDTLRAVTQSEAHRRLVAAIGPTSMMGVPLIVQDRLLGALVVAWCRPERRYGPSDLRLLEEVGRRAALALENARLYRAVEHAVQARDDVLGIVAHDLRAPLSAILMHTALIRSRGAEPAPGLRPPVDVIDLAATRMSRLIQDLLDVTRMEAGHLAIDPARVSTRQLVTEAVEAQQSLAASASIELRVEIAPVVADVWGDRDRLLQAFDNLIGNAIKFTPPSGGIVVAAAAREGEVLFRVTDTGAGIPAEEVPHVFDRFWQARRTERRGAGLGLAIVKGIVEAHGGRLWVESTPGHGSSFLFAIPAAPGAGAPTAGSTPDPT
jgi:PAS domain S-box-containing protein